MKYSRRDLTIATLTAAFLGEAASAKAAPHPTSTGSAENIAMLLFPGMTALDLVGPLGALGWMMGAHIQLVAATKAPLLADNQLTILPTHTYQDVPADLDVLFVPGGGPGTIAAIEDDALMSFVAERGCRARYVTSVCTGSAILGAAGLLRGYRATSHWVIRDTVLPLVGATPVKARYVRDRNRITGAGVTSGLDFGLRLQQELRGEASARFGQLITEYDPQPPFPGGGNPEKARSDVVVQALEFSAGLRDGVAAAARVRAKTWSDEH